MKPTSFKADQRENPSYVRVVLAHKDWLAESLTSAQFKKILGEEHLNLKEERAHLLASQRQKPDDMLEVMADVLTEALQGVEMMLSTLEHDDEEGVLMGLSTLARATSAILEAQKHL